MKRNASYSIAFILGVCLVLQGCEKKFDLAVLPNPGQPTVIGDTNYVEILPPFESFESPRGMMVGNDQLIYVTDYDRNELVMMDAGGSILKHRSILHPIAVAQNTKLDIYVGGETIAPNGIDTIGAVYRIYLVRFDTTYVARIDTIINPSTGDTTINVVRRDTSYFFNHDLDNAPMRLVWQDAGRPLRRFTGIGVFPDNEYLVTRTGPDNSSFVDPDSRVLYFNKHDILITPLGDLVTRPSGGTAITDIRNLTSILILPFSRDFILTQNSEGVAYSAIWMFYQNVPNFQGWLPRFDPTKPEQRSIDFIRAYRFSNAIGIAYDKGRREVFIVDSEQDSVVKFNRNGQFRRESFGKYRTASDQFPGLNAPSGIGFSNDCTLYVADTGNKVVRRFKLSTQTQCN